MAAVNDEELIDAYCDGELSGEEALALEARLATEPALEGLLRRRERLFEGLQFLFREGEPAQGDLLTSRQAILQERASRRQRGRRRLLMLLAGACGAIALGGGGLLLRRAQHQQEWRLRILRALEPSGGCVRIRAESALATEREGYEIIFRDDRHWRIEAIGELPLPSWLGERRGEPQFAPEESGLLALGRIGGELWFYRAPRSLLFVWEEAPAFPFWPTDPAGPLGALSAQRERLLSFARGEEGADRGHSQEDGTLILARPGVPPIRVALKDEGLLWHCGVKRFSATPCTGAEDSFRLRAQGLAPRRRPWTASPL